MKSRELPPIASPHGRDTFPFPARPDESCVRVAVALRPAAVVRYFAWEALTPLTAIAIFGAPALGAYGFLLEYRHFGLLALPLVFLGLLLALVFISAPIALFCRLCSRRRFEIWVAPAGVFKRYPKRDIFFSWSKFMWILERGGDVWLASFSEGCFIPRESFGSKEEVRQFVEIARELKRTRGSVWRDKWNGRTFGLHEELNNPR